MLWSHLVCHYWEGHLDGLLIKLFQHFVPRLSAVLWILIRLRLCWHSEAEEPGGSAAPSLSQAVDTSALRTLHPAHSDLLVVFMPLISRLPFPVIKIPTTAPPQKLIKASWNATTNICIILEELNKELIITTQNRSCCLFVMQHYIVHIFDVSWIHKFTY